MFDPNLDFNKKLNSSTSLPIPKVAPPEVEVRAPVSPRPVPKDIRVQKKSSERPQKLGVKDINFSKTWKIKRGINDPGFRNRINQGFKGTLKSYADRKTVADILWNARGQGGISEWELKKGLRNSNLRPDQIRAVRKKLSAF